MSFIERLVSLLLNVAIGSAVLVLLLIVVTALVWLIIAVVLGVFENRRTRRERDAGTGSDTEDRFDISLL